MADLCSTETTVMTPLSDDKYMDEALAEAENADAALEENKAKIAVVRELCEWIYWIAVMPA